MSLSLVVDCSPQSAFPPKDAARLTLVRQIGVVAASGSVAFVPFFRRPMNAQTDFLPCCHYRGMAGVVCTLRALAGSEACREYESARRAYR